METKKLAKQSLIYSFASILTQTVTLLMVPVFTKNMSQHQFGQYSLLISVQSLLAIFITVGVYSGMTRFINEFEDQNKTKNIVLTFSLAWGLAMFFFSLLFSNLLYKLLFPLESDGGFYINFLVGSAVLLCLISIYISYYTMQFKPKIVSTINFSRAFFILLFSVFFIMIRKEGLYGALQAQLYAYAVVLAGLIIYDRKNIRVAFEWDKLKVMLKYSLGLIPGQASAWIFTLIDRYFIYAMMGLQQVAVYSMGYKLGMMMEPLLISPFKSVFTSFKYKVYKEADAPKRFREIYGYYNFAGWFCVLGFSVFARPAIALLSTLEYAEAFMVVPLIVFSYFLYGLGEFYSLGIHIENKPLLDSLILGVGGGSNILLNIGLIPKLGIMGAAVATILSYFIMNIMYFIIGKKYLDLGLRYFEPFKGGFLVLGLLVLYYSTYNFLNNFFIEIIFSSSLCLLFLVLGFQIGLIPREAATNAISQIARKIGLAKSSENIGL